jgi:phage tail sheath protein FI
MPVFVTTSSTVTRHGAFAIERTPPAQITPTGTFQPAIVDQFPWGPYSTTNGIIYTPASIKDFTNTYAPPGFSRTGMGYLASIRKAWPNNSLKACRVLGLTAAAATALVQTAGASTIWTVGAKYSGVSGNSMTCTTTASSDGVAGHIKLSITITGPSGTTTDVIDNLPTAAAPNPLPDLSKMLLVGSLTFGSGGTAVQSTVNFSGGLDGTINAASYSGTPGNGDFGIARLETDTTIRHAFTGDPGNTLRVGVNTALVAHAALMTDRVVYVNGNSGQSASAVLTDVAQYQSTRAVYTDPWVYILDDTTGLKTLVPSAPFAASVASQLSPSTSIAWKNTEVQAMLAGIVDLETDRGANAGNNTLNGIATFIRELTGGFTIEAGVVTNAPVDNTRRTLARTRMGDYIAISFVNSVRSMVDAPNVPYNQDIIIQALEMFMGSLKKSASVDPNHRPHVLDYAIGNLSAANVQTDLDQGNFFVPLDVKTSSAMERIFLSIRYGETVQVQHLS